MNHSVLSDFLSFAFDQRVKAKNPVVPMIWGLTGVGKTQGVSKFAESIGAKLTVIHLASQEPGDLIGSPYCVGGKTVNLRPEWLPDEDCKDTHVIFLDEFNRAPKAVLDVMLPFLLNGELHTHRLPKNTMIVAAANPDDGDDYSVTSIDDKAMLSRLCHIKLVTGVDSWIEHCKDRVHESFVTAIKEQGFKSKFDLPNVEHDGRSLEISGSAVKDMTDEQYDLFGHEFLLGMVGPIGSIINNEIVNKGLRKHKIDPVDVIDNYDNVKEKVAQAANNDAPAIAELSEVVSDVLLEMKSLSPENVANIGKFVLDLPNENMTAFFTKIIKMTHSRNQEDRERALNLVTYLADIDSKAMEKIRKIGLTQ